MLFFMFFFTSYDKVTHTLCVQRKLKERHKERKRIDRSYLRNAVIKETGLRIEPYGDEVARSYSLGDRMKWNSKPSPPSTPRPSP